MTTFEDLKKLNQWVCWKNENKGGKMTKVPYQVNGVHARSNDSQTWNSHDACVRAVKVMDYDGIGFVFTSGDSYVGVDIDDCITEEGIHPKAIQIITHLNSYAEISPSETGVKIWVKDENKIADLRKKKFEIAEGMTVEIYREGRYFTVTNNVLDLSTEMVVEAGAELNEIIDMYVSKESNVFDDGEYDGIPDGEDNFTEAECEAYLKNQIAIATYRIKNMKDGDKHRTRYIMGRLVGGAIQAVRNAGYQVSATEHKEIIDALYDVNPPSDNHEQERKAIYDGIQAGANTPTRIRKIAQDSSSDVMELIIADEHLVSSIGEYFNGLHPVHSINDSDLATLFLHLFGDDIKYSGATHTWYEWKSNVWFSNEPDDKSLAITKTVEMLNALYEYGNLIPDEKEAHKYKTTVSNHKSHSRIDGVVKLAQADVSKHFNIDKSVDYPHYYPVSNGIIDLRNGNLIPHNKKYGFMKVVDITYDKTADAPEWKKFIDMIFLGRTELITYVQTALGYSISGGSGLQILFYCLGSGGNGKSTLYNVIEMIAGKGQWYKKTDVAALTLKTREDPSELKPYIAKLRDVRVTVAPEAIKGKQLDYSLIKEITGSETLTGRDLYTSTIEFAPTHTLWISGNKLPEMKEHDDGIWRRFKIIPFDYKIPDDKKMSMDESKAMYREELAGILNWFVEGAIMLYKTNKMPECEVVENLSKTFRKDSDIYEMFLEECCDVDRNDISAYWVKKKLAWSVFYSWLKEANLYERVNRPLFTQELTERLGFMVGKKGKEFYLGFRIKPEYLKNIYEDVEKLNGFGRKDLDEEEPTGFKPKIVQMPARNLPIPLDDVAEDTF